MSGNELLLIKSALLTGRRVVIIIINYYWASEASPTLGCSIEISRDIYIHIYVVGMSVVCQINCVGGIT